MEIEKTRETTWKIRLRRNDGIIELTSVEISGEVRNIKLALRKEKDLIRVEMGKGEFFNFLSLISAFKDVIIGEDINYLQDKLTDVEIYDNHEEIITGKDNLNEIVENNNSENEPNDLNPEEWDPW
ncbi:MAG: hypothetical protein KGD73_02935 [Candidatus Lokiarchaeota archaeon]|nr:hypothetical protein [Candidatus Lokiarchaeota archaeon]